MPDRVRRKWRPALWLVLGGALGLMMAMPVAGLLALRAMQGALGFRHAALLVCAAVALVTLVLGFLLWRLLLLPIKDLAARTAEVRQGVPAGALRHYGTAELGALGVSVLGMARSLQDREATIRHFADHVTHELKSPLTAIKGAAELLAGEADARLVATIEAAVRQMEAQLAGLRRVTAAREVLYRGRCDLAEVAAGLTGLEVRADAGEVPIAAEGLAIVLGHLARNAAEHGASRLEVRLQDAALLISDDGAGISQGNRARIFEPFFTSRREAGGTGMGLAIVRGLLAANGAEISLEAGPATCFRIVFAEG